MFAPSDPEKEEVSLHLVGSGRTIDRWTEYSFTSHMMNATDGWHFTVGADQEAMGDLLTGLRIGAEVELRVNGNVQSTGFVDSVEVHASKGSGLEYHIAGRDRLAQACDACADPTVTFQDSHTLLDALKQLFGPFGWKNDDDFVVSADADRDLRTGGIRGQKLSKKGKPLKSYALHQLQPHSREGVFEFASRIAKRFGLTIWASASGKQLIVSRPSFEGAPHYKIRRNRSGSTNVVDGTVRFDISDQPTLIIADGFSGGGEFGKGRIKSKMANTAVITGDKRFADDWNRYPEAKPLTGHAFPKPIQVPRSRTLYLHDDESQTQAQLDNFVRRQMAELQRKSVAASYTVVGHGQETKEGFAVWTVDTTVDVEDEVTGLYERMYVVGRTFAKSRHSGGTSTRLELIRLNTIEFGEPIQPTVVPKGSGFSNGAGGRGERERTSWLFDEGEKKVVAAPAEPAPELPLINRVLLWFLE